MHTTATPRAAVRRRRSLLTAVVAAVVASLVLVPSAAQAEQSVPAQNAGGALQRYLASHDDHFHTVFQGTEFADYGLTLDGVIAMDAAGVGDAAGRREGWVWCARSVPSSLRFVTRTRMRAVTA